MPHRLPWKGLFVMPKKQPMVHAYDKTTGKKLHHLVPNHFVEAGSPFPNLSATPRNKDATKATTTSDPTNTDSKSGSNAAGGKAGAPTTKEK